MSENQHLLTSSNPYASTSSPYPLPTSYPSYQVELTSVAPYQFQPTAISEYQAPSYTLPKTIVVLCYIVAILVWTNEILVLFLDARWTSIAALTAALVGALLLVKGVRSCNLKSINMSMFCFIIAIVLRIIVMVIGIQILHDSIYSASYMISSMSMFILLFALVMASKAYRVAKKLLIAPTYYSVPQTGLSISIPVPATVPVSYRIAPRYVAGAMPGTEQQLSSLSHVMTRSDTAQNWQIVLSGLIHNIIHPNFQIVIGSNPPGGRPAQEIQSTYLIFLFERSPSTRHHWTSRFNNFYRDDAKPWSEMVAEIVSADKHGTLHYEIMKSIIDSDYLVMKTKWDACFHDLDRFLSV